MRAQLLLYRWLLSGAVMLLSMRVQAHHSFAQFDTSSTTKLQGTIKSFEWTNPHGWIWIYVDDASGTPQLWGAETQSPNGLVRSGWDKHSFNPGEQATIELHPMRDGSKAGEFVRAVNASGHVLLPVGGK